MEERPYSAETVRRTHDPYPITHHPFRRLQLPTAGKDRQTAEQPLLLRRQQIVAPGDRRAQGAVTRGRSRAPRSAAAAPVPGGRATRRAPDRAPAPRLFRAPAAGHRAADRSPRPSPRSMRSGRSPPGRRAAGPAKNLSKCCYEGQDLRAQLPADSRQLLELRLAGLTDTEIATVLGKSHGAVRTAQHRTVVRLRELRAAIEESERVRV
jgi:hypothetical protein